MELLSRKLFHVSSGIVMAGPFAGMKYVEEARGSVFCPKLIGCYEEELQPIIRQVVKNQYVWIVDVGAAEGYYAIGLARCLPESKVVAFDCEPQAQALCRQMACLNGVQERLTVLGACSPASFNSVLQPHALVICDCEGYENELLDPGVVTELKACDILVEMHDFLCEGSSARLQQRFSSSHQIEWIDIHQRDAMSYPQINSLTVREKLLAVNEFRPAKQQWAWMTVKEGIRS
jgi:hypothetical protein